MSDLQLTISSRIRDYTVNVSSEPVFLEKLAAVENSAFFIDKKVYVLYEDLFKKYLGDRDIFMIEAVEENKTLEYAAELFTYLTKRAVKKNLTIISIGGGIVQDVTGFVASTLYRGVNWLFVPTTFLAMTDSCIGSKTSINFFSYKNLIGTFFPPSEVYIATSFIKTLETNDFFSGVGETIKLQLMKEEYPKNYQDIIALIASLDSKKPESLTKVILNNLDVKRSYMENDEFDMGKRNLLNYGHCFGHALETSSGYYVPHGIAVTIGMIYANFAAFNRGNIDQELLDELNNRLFLPAIPLALRAKDFNGEILLKSLKNDKKRVGTNLAIVIPNPDFSLVKVDDFTEEEFSKVLTQVVGFLSASSNWQN